MSRCQGLNFNGAILLLCQPPTWTLSLPIPSYFPDNVILLPKRQVSLFLTAFELLCLLPELLWIFKYFLYVWMLFTSSLSGNLYSEPTFFFFYGTLHEFACHPYAGPMLIFSVSFQFFSICAAKASTLNQLWFFFLRYNCHTELLSIISIPIIVQLLSHVWLRDLMGCSTPGFSVLHYLPEFAQIHVH